ncbi:MAG: methyltransferase domain-containing protein [Bacillota bacterium]
MKGFAEKSRESYNRIADHYDDTLEGNYTREFKQGLLDVISAKPGEQLLDIGCGNGTLIRMLADKYKIKGFGTDISEKMIENARQKNPGMTFEVAECEKTPFEDQTFDIITVCAAYHHFPDVAAFAKEARRLLRDNGKLYIADVYYPTLIRILCNPILPLSKAGDVKFYSPEEIAATFGAQGFQKTHLTRTGHIQIISFQK